MKQSKSIILETVLSEEQVEMLMRNNRKDLIDKAIEDDSQNIARYAYYFLDHTRGQAFPKELIYKYLDGFFINDRVINHHKTENYRTHIRVILSHNAIVGDPDLIEEFERAVDSKVFDGTNGDNTDSCRLAFHLLNELMSRFWEDKTDILPNQRMIDMAYRYASDIGKERIHRFLIDFNEYKKTLKESMQLNESTFRLSSEQMEMLIRHDKQDLIKKAIDSSPDNLAEYLWIIAKDFNKPLDLDLSKRFISELPGMVTWTRDSVLNRVLNRAFTHQPLNVAYDLFKDVKNIHYFDEHKINSLAYSIVLGMLPLVPAWVTKKVKIPKELIDRSRTYLYGEYYHDNPEKLKDKLEYVDSRLEGVEIIPESFNVLSESKLSDEQIEMLERNNRHDLIEKAIENDDIFLDYMAYLSDKILGIDTDKLIDLPKKYINRLGDLHVTESSENFKKGVMSRVLGHLLRRHLNKSLQFNNQEDLDYYEKEVLKYIAALPERERLRNSWDIARCYLIYDRTKRKIPEVIRAYAKKCVEENEGDSLSANLLKHIIARDGSRRFKPYPKPVRKVPKPIAPQDEKI
jgi:hypothetical protein